ncbi:hypothetical protein EVAR_97748_1 [Eumeta japonica]|uniref:Uncharacterized protein n=1 Tax=Eumeta variegata TaxID=151549 RepID=A0A4C1X610_EUMVA|nr:hypothetical protein EVAR_97748_1 [Eumeta japonica]
MSLNHFRRRRTSRLHELGQLAFRVLEQLFIERWNCVSPNQPPLCIGGTRDGHRPLRHTRPCCPATCVKIHLHHLCPSAADWSASPWNGISIRDPAKCYI